MTDPYPRIIDIDQWDKYLPHAEKLLHVLFVYDLIAREHHCSFNDVGLVIQSKGLKIQDYSDQAAAKANAYITLYRNHKRQYHTEHHPLLQLLTQEAEALLLAYAEELKAVVEQEGKLADSKKTELMFNLLLKNTSSDNASNLARFANRFFIQVYHDCLYHLGDANSPQTRLMKQVRHDSTWHAKSMTNHGSGDMAQKARSVENIISQPFTQGQLTLNFCQPLGGPFSQTTCDTAGKLAAGLIYPDGKGGYVAQHTEESMSSAPPNGTNELASLVWALTNESTPKDFANPERLEHWLRIAVAIALTVPFKTQDGITQLSHNFFLMLTNNPAIFQALNRGPATQENIALFVKNLIEDGIEFAHDDVGNFLRGGKELYLGDRRVAAEIHINALENGASACDPYEQLFIALKAYAGCVSEDHFRRSLKLDSTTSVGFIGFIKQKAQQGVIYHRPSTEKEIISGLTEPFVKGTKHLHMKALLNLKETASWHLQDIQRIVRQLAIHHIYNDTDKMLQDGSGDILESSYWQKHKKEVIEAVSKGVSPQKILAPGEDMLFESKRPFEFGPPVSPVKS